MTRYFLRRLGLVPVGLLLANFLGFAYAHLVRPIQSAANPLFAGTSGAAPLLPAYAAYLRGLSHLDFGKLPPAGAPVGPLIAEATLASMGLLALALLLSVVLGVGLGLRAVRSDPPGIAPWLTILSTLGLAMPGFYIGSLLILAALAYIIWGPGSPALPAQGFGWDLHLLLPTLVLAARPTAQIAQVTAGLLVAEMDKMYIVTARSVGNPWQVVRRRHALRNVVAPVAVAVFGALRLAVSELIVVEWIFGWPGLGRLLAWTLLAPQSTSGVRPVFLHPPTLAATLAVLATIFLLGDLSSGFLARLVDPRLRAASQPTQGDSYG